MGDAVFKLLLAKVMFDSKLVHGKVLVGVADEVYLIGIFDIL